MRANNLTSLNSIKSYLELPASFTTHDKLIENLIDSASAFLSRITKRKLKYGAYVEYNDGGRSTIILDNYPIITLTSIHEDANREYPSSSLLTLGDDYEILDSEAAIIRSLNGGFSKGYSMYKITYSAGISSYWFDAGLAFKDAQAGGTLTASLAGEYTAETLPAAIKAAMEAVSSNTYTVTFSSSLHKFTIATSGSYLELDYASSPDAYEEIGFTSAKTGDTSYTSDAPAPGVSPDIREIADELVLLRYKYFTKDRLGIISESRGEQSFSYDFRDLPAALSTRIESIRDRRIKQ